MYINKIKDWCYDNWEIIIVVVIILIVVMNAYNCNQQDQSIDNTQKYFETNELTHGYIIYCTDGRIEEVQDFSQYIKINK